MTCDTIFLRNEDKDVRLCTYISSCTGDMGVRPRDAVLILPGGAYAFLAEREAEPVAKTVLAAGFNAFVLYYSVGENAKYPRPLVDVSLAICHIRENAEKYNIDPDRIFVCGFSAGGHLAGAIGTLWDREYAKATPDMPFGMNKPHGVILSYPLITMGKYSHEYGRGLITGNGEDAEFWKQECSLELQVRETTVPAFVWQTQEDDCVSIQNSMLYAQALIDHNIPVELHIYPKGPHGMSVVAEETSQTNPAQRDPHVGGWVKAALEWMKII